MRQSAVRYPSRNTAHVMGLRGQHWQPRRVCYGGLSHAAPSATLHKAYELGGGVLSTSPAPLYERLAVSVPSGTGTAVHEAAAPKSCPWESTAEARRDVQLPLRSVMDSLATY